MTLVTEHKYFNEDLDPGRYAFIKVLSDRILYNGEIVPVLSTFPPEEVIPCITMNSEGGLGLVNESIQYRVTPLDEDHPYYDPSHPEYKYCQEMVKVETHKRSLSLHVWGLTGEDRDAIVPKIADHIARARMGLYPYCTHYRAYDKQCMVTKAPCDALTVKNAQSLEMRCPYSTVTDVSSPKYRDYKNIFDEVNIYRESVLPRGESNVDQRDTNPTIYHTAITYDYKIDIERVVDAVPLCNIVRDEADVLK